MPSFVDLTGSKFGRLLALEYRKGSRRVKGKWVCECDCGQIVAVASDKLISGHTSSCGCLQRERTSEANKTHGLRNSRLYKTWCNMKTRCYNPKNSDYHNYGGRGITVCDEWRNDFKAFYDWAIANGYRDDLSIDRKDVNKGYSPDNCRWATDLEQARNKVGTVKITLYGETKSLKDWCDMYGLNYYAVYDKLRNGLSPEDAFRKEGDLIVQVV